MAEVGVRGGHPRLGGEALAIGALGGGELPPLLARAAGEKERVAARRFPLRARLSATFG